MGRKLALTTSARYRTRVRSRSDLPRLGEDLFGIDRLHLATVVCGETAFDFNFPCRLDIVERRCSQRLQEQVNQTVAIIG